MWCSCGVQDFQEAMQERGVKSMELLVCAAVCEQKGEISITFSGDLDGEIARGILL